MHPTLPLLRPLALAALLAGSATAHAALTLHTSLPSFSAVTVLPGTDTFSDISTATSTPSPTVRSTTVGAVYGYTASSIANYFSGPSASPSDFYGVAESGGVALSTNLFVDTMVLDNFTGGARAIGANFWGTDVLGNTVPAVLRITVTDSLGASLTHTLNNPVPGSFLGFTSNGLITQMLVTVQQGVDPAWPTVDNLVVAVPEPGTFALLLAGLVSVGWMARRRQA